MDTLKIKTELASLVNDAKAMTDRYTALSIALRYVERRAVNELTGKDVGNVTLDELVQTLRVQLGALDRSLTLLVDELWSASRRLPAPAPSGGGGGNKGLNN